MAEPCTELVQIQAELNTNMDFEWVDKNITEDNIHGQKMLVVGMSGFFRIKLIDGEIAKCLRNLRNKPVPFSPGEWNQIKNA